MNDIETSRGLGLFSIGLGLAEVLATRQLGRAIGLSHRKGLLRVFGAREIAAGVSLLGYPDSPAAMWARVAGDAMDLTLLGSALSRSNPRRMGAAVATVAVAGVTVLDVMCALSLTACKMRAHATAQRTRVAAVRG